MYYTMKERGSLGPRREFDELPISSDVQAEPARYKQLAALADMAHRLVPGVGASEFDLARYLTFDPDCILTFSRNGRLLGGMAFLFLNHRGHDALLLDEIYLTKPDIGLLSRSDEDVSAIYIWAIAAVGRGIGGLGNAAAHLRKPRYKAADCFAQPSSAAGRNIMFATGFRQTPSFQPDLWCYTRPWNRAPRIETPSYIVQRGAL
ncbi:MAG: hypothetical protein WA702_22085 [Bradyrhizobium sp.]|jgi:hypothetical protein